MDSYRSLDAWKVAHEAALLAHKACDRAYHSRARAVFDQLRRASLSVEANLVEGYALGTPGLCRRHLRIAFGSAAEAECVARLASPLLAGERIDVDRADVTEITRLPRIGPAFAQRIVTWRTTHGPFGSLGRLDSVPGVGPKLLEAVRPYVMFSGEIPAPP